MTNKERLAGTMQGEKVSTASTAVSPKAETVLPVQLQGAIGRQLKQVYGQLLAEPLPDKFALLLEQLGKSDTKS